MAHPENNVFKYTHTKIYSHLLRDCFVLSEFFSMARHVGRSKPGSKPIQLYVRLSLRPLGQQAYHVWLREFLRYLCSNSSVRLFTFLYPIGYQSTQFFRRPLHYASGGRKFLHQSAQPPWGSVYCHPQTDCFVLSELFSVARHVGRSKPGSKPIYIYIYIYINYLRYDDDILLLVNSTNKLHNLRLAFQNNSVLNFTHELNRNY